MDANEWEAFYRYAESNIVGYKRPADYLERVERVLNNEFKRTPMRENDNEKHRIGKRIE